MSADPVLLIGAGRLGGALLTGWRAAPAPPFDRLLIRCPRANPAVDAAVAAGARFNPPDAALAEVATVVLAVKPQKLRDVAAAYDLLLPSEAVVLSLAAGVRLADVADAFSGRRTARVMPTTGVAIGRGVAAVHAPDAEARARAHALFEPVATVADLADEAQMDAAAAVVGSGPAYLYAFTEALERAGAEVGLPPEAARDFARATVTGAAAHLDASGAEPAELRAQVASPGGITEAALKVLGGAGGLEPLLAAALTANMARSRELAG